MLQEKEGVSSEKKQIPWCRYSKRVALTTILKNSDEWRELGGEKLVVGGWIKSCREMSKRSFQFGNVVSTDVTCTELIVNRFPFLRSLAKLLDSEASRKAPKQIVTLLKINDGSCIRNLQVLIEDTVKPTIGQLTVGASILVEGVLKQPIPGKGAIQLVAERVLHVGNSNPYKYPFSRQRLSLESSRRYPQFRARTTTIGAITRIRDGLYSASGSFFQKNGFLHVQMPVITTAYPSNHGSIFQVRALFEDKSRITPLDVVEAATGEKNPRVEELGRSCSNKETQWSSKERKMDFFSQPAYLSKSAGLHLESYACALGNVYTFGPIFEAKAPESSTCLAEMWMVEVELAFSELENAMDCAEDYLKFMCKSILESRPDDMNFVTKEVDESCADRLQLAISTPFRRISYTDAVEALEKVTDKVFQSKIHWGSELSREHESYLVDEMLKCPAIVYNHPKEIRPFNSRLRDDNKTVDSFDVIMPKVGVLIRGCQKEERAEVLAARMNSLGISSEHYEWYLDLRRHGTVSHAGFSMDFQAMIMLAAGVEDASDVVPFPRISGNIAP